MVRRAARLSHRSRSRRPHRGAVALRSRARRGPRRRRRGVLRRSRRQGGRAMSDKVILCACEDVSLHEVETAIDRGFADIESLKRYTGLGTGPCQGKSCESAAMRICAQRKAVPVEAQVPFRARPPLMPTAMAEYAGLDLPASDRRSAGLKPTWGKGPHPLQPSEKLPE